MDNEEYVKALEATGNYKVLRRVLPRRTFNPKVGAPFKRAIVLDIETTGLDRRSDEIVELAMLKFEYSPEGVIFDVVDECIQLNQPAVELSREVSKLTGLSFADLQGRHLSITEIDSFVDDASLIIAHNAAFDRPFCERVSQRFAQKPWACSMSEIKWRHHGFPNSSLVSILAHAGLFYDAHRASNDCFALLEILSRPLPNGSELAFKKLLESARETTVRLWALDAPYEKRGILKERGYRWSDGTGGAPRSWWIDLPEAEVNEEINFLKSAVLLPGAVLKEMTFTAYERYSSRIS